LYTKELSKYYDYPLTSTTLQVAGSLVALIISEEEGRGRGGEERTKKECYYGL
jgi:hypothetical protein